MDYMDLAIMEEEEDLKLWRTKPSKSKPPLFVAFPAYM
jgi:hypothetical protein